MKLPVEDIIEWDILNWSQLIPQWTPILDSLSRDVKVLTIGERNGGLSLWLALMGFEVLCTDREGPTAFARQLHQKYGVEQKIKYASLDIIHTDLQHGQFDLILAKSVIGGLKEDHTNRHTRSFQIQQQAITNIYNLLKPNGYYLFAENIKGSVLLDLVRRFKGKHRGWRYLTPSEINSFCNCFSLINVQTFGIIPSGAPTNSLGKVSYWLNRVLNFLPANMKYIAFTSAQK